MRRYFVISGLLLLLFLFNSFAATQGELAPTSTATFGLSVGLDQSVLISNMSGDVRVTRDQWSPSFITTPVNFCVYSNTSDNNYQITAIGSNPQPTGPGVLAGYTFQAVSQAPAGGESSYFQYKVDFYPNGTATGTSYDLQNGTVSPQAFQGSNVDNCNGVNNASITLQMATPSMATGALSGVYQDTLQLEVTPAV